MAYVSSDAPLPLNSQTPMSACEIAARAAAVAGVEQMVNDAQAASAQIAPPSSFVSMGQGVVNDATRSQNQLIAAQKLQNMPIRNGGSDDLRLAPTVVPLNVPPEQFHTCSIRGVGAIRPLLISQGQQRVVMPQTAPTDTRLLYSGDIFAPRLTAPMTSGLGVIWGDATGAPNGSGNGNGGGMSGNAWMWLALTGIGFLWGMTRGNKHNGRG